MKKLIWIIFIFGLPVALAGGAYVYYGVFNVAATEQHSALTYHVLHYAMQHSVHARAKDIQIPDLSNEHRLRNGSVLYRTHCLQCHGAPGVAPDPLGFGTRPAPANLVEAGRDWPTVDVYWVIKHGLKMTAMPGWQYRLSEQELWDLTAFVKVLPKISPIQYRDEVKTQPPAKTVTLASSGDSDGRLGNPKAGRHAIEQYLCATCHLIPGVVGANGTVGPELNGIATRTFIGGVLPNTPANMMKWLRDPQAIDPLSGMPDLHIREQDIRDIAAYLYTLK